MTVLLAGDPAHDRIRKANAREGGRHRRIVAWLGESTHARHDMTTESVENRRKCPACSPTAYAVHFARHRAMTCDHNCRVTPATLNDEWNHYLDCPVWVAALAPGRRSL